MALVISVFLVGIHYTTAAGAVIIVNSVLDKVDLVPGDGIVDTGTPGEVTLRAAIMEANVLAGADEIKLPAGTYMITIAGAENAGAAGDLDITDNLSIIGTDASQTIIDGNSLDRVFDVLSNAAATFTRLTITGGNTNGPGGGISSSPGVTVTVNETAIVDNDALAGAAIYHNLGTLEITSSTISRNQASSSGGAIDSYGGPITIINSTFADNTAPGGGAIRQQSGTLQITATTFSGNQAGSGGAISSRGVNGSLTLTNTTLSGNRSYYSGGAILSIVPTVILNSTITANAADASGALGGGINMSTGAIAEVKNSIIALNTTPNTTLFPSPDVFGAFTSQGNNLIGIDGLATGFTNGVNGDQVGTEAGPIDPLLYSLADNGGPTFTHALLPGSPALDAGNNTGAPPNDQRGGPRPFDGDGDGIATVDIGAYEYYREPVTIYVDADATGANDGTSWADAYKYLQDAMADANSNPDVNEIWVAEGIYTPDSNSADPNGSRDRTATFQLINGVALYGGFAGGETRLDERNWQTNQTILSGDLNGNDVGFTNNGENCCHVVTGSGTDANAVIDGFNITAGNANGSFPDYLGGGMYCDNGSSMVTNCTFVGNSAGQGSGMYNNNNSSPTVTNCTFRGNSAALGGGVFNFSGSPTITNCTFSGNSAIGSGGGMYNGNNRAAITNCTFSDNSANIGGGMFNSMFNSSSSPTLTNCTFSGNSASNSGGGMFNNGSNPTVTNCTFSGNSANSYGGGMNNENNSNPTVTNCTFCGNSVNFIGGGMMFNRSGSPTLTNCTLWGDTAVSGNEIAVINSSIIDVNYCDVKGEKAGIYNDGTGTVNWGSGNIDADPMFVDANNPDPNLRDYHIRPGSPCIDAGDNNSIPADTADLDNDGNTAEPIPFDIDTDVRISGGTVDMGSDEAIWDSNDNVDQAETVIMNPGGGDTDPNTEALVVFENVSGPNDATIEVTEVGTDLYPDGLFRALGTTIRIDTTLADGWFCMTVTIPFDTNHLSGADPFTVDLLYWEQPPGKWRHAVKANTDPQQSNSKNNRWQEEYPPDTAPTLADLKARGIGANGVFFNSMMQKGFVWANVDHTTDFEGLSHNIADFEPDGDVDLADFAVFALNWMDTACGVCSGADFTGEGDVRSDDLQEFAKNWLAGVE